MPITAMLTILTS